MVDTQEFILTLVKWNSKSVNSYPVKPNQVQLKDFLFKFTSNERTKVLKKELASKANCNASNNLIYKVTTSKDSTFYILFIDDEVHVGLGMDMSNEEVFSSSSKKKYFFKNTLLFKSLYNKAPQSEDVKYLTKFIRLKCKEVTVYQSRDYELIENILSLNSYFNEKLVLKKNIISKVKRNLISDPKLFKIETCENNIFYIKFTDTRIYLGLSISSKKR